MSASGTLTAYLGHVRSRLLAVARRRAGWAVLAALTAICWMVPVVGSAGAPPLVVRLGLGLLLLVVIVGGLLWGILLPRAQYLRDDKVATYVGRVVPRLRSDLLSAVEFSHGPSPTSLALRTAHIDATTRALAAVPPASIAPPLRTGWLALLVVALNLGHAAWAYENQPSYWRSWNVLFREPGPMDRADRVSVRLVKDLRLTIEPPTYSRRPSVELPDATGDFRALAGSRVAINAAVVGVPKRAGIWFSNDDGVSNMLALTQQGNTWSAEWNVSESVRYQFWTETADGSRSLENFPRRIDVEVDQTPQVAVSAPADELDVTTLRRIELGYSADDDFEVAAIELVWRVGDATDLYRASLPIADAAARASVRGRWIWDLATVQPLVGATIRYWVEATDNRTPQPQVGRSRELTLRVVSEQQRHDTLLQRLSDVSKEVTSQLAARLVDSPDIAIRVEWNRQLAALLPELGAIAASAETDPRAQPGMSRQLVALRERLSRLLDAEGKWLDSSPTSPWPRAAGGGLRIIGELEDAVLSMLDLLERERLEDVLDAADEATTRAARLRSLFVEFAKTGDASLQQEIDRELGALAQQFSALSQLRARLGEDVVDAYFNYMALDDVSAASCFANVRRLATSQQATAAQAELERCVALLANAQAALENSLNQLRGDRFGEEQRQFESLLGELADLSHEQAEIATDAQRSFAIYVRKADALVKVVEREARLELNDLLARSKKRIRAIPARDLVPIAQEEIAIAAKRLDDAEMMLREGDLTEASAMVRQAMASLEAAIDASTETNDQTGPLTKNRALAIERAQKSADALLEALEDFAPEPRDVFTREELRDIDRLRVRQTHVRSRARAFAAQVGKQSNNLPGDAGRALTERLAQAIPRMLLAESRARKPDPGQFAYETDAAARILKDATPAARGAARQQILPDAAANEPLRIPDADAFIPPKEFRLELLEGMKRATPQGYDDAVRQYFQELAR